MNNKYDHNFEDKDMMKSLIDSRDSKYYFMPLYINLFGKKYAILDIDNIIQSVPKSSFKIGFGTSHSVIGNKMNFPTGQMYLYNCAESFKYTDDETGVDTHYFVLEETYMNDDESSINKEINMWIDCLFDKVDEHVKEYKKSLKNIVEENDIVESKSYDNTEIDFSDDDIEEDEVGDDYFE